MIMCTHICLLRFKKIISSPALGLFFVIYHNSTTNGNTVTFQIYLKVITSHYFNNCHPKKVRWLLSEMLITAWSLVCFYLASSFHLNSSGEGITGNFNRKVFTVSTISAIYLAFLHKVWSYCWKQVAYCFLKFL